MRIDIKYAPFSRSDIFKVTMEMLQVTMKRYSLEDLEEAVEKVETGSGSVGKISKQYNIPYNSLKSAVRKRNVKGDFTVLESILEQEEADLIDYVQFMAKRHSPLTETNLMDMLMESLTSCTAVKTHQFYGNDLKKVCQEYLVKFRQTNGMLLTESPEKQSTEILLQDLQTLLDTQDKLQQVYSCGEVPINKVFDTTLVNTLLCVNAAGQVLPSMIVHTEKSQEMLEEVNKPSSWIYASSKDAEVSCELFYQWYKEVFLHHCSPAKPVVLLMDASQMSLKLHKLAKISQVELFLVPGHCKTTLQPVHCGLVQSLQQFYNSMCSQPGFQVSRDQFPVVWYTCIHSVLKPQLIHTAFRQAAIFTGRTGSELDVCRALPVNEDIIESTATSIPQASVTGVREPCEAEVHTQLTDWSTTEAVEHTLDMLAVQEESVVEWMIAQDNMKDESKSQDIINNDRGEKDPSHCVMEDCQSQTLLSQNVWNGNQSVMFKPQGIMTDNQDSALTAQYTVRHESPVECAAGSEQSVLLANHQNKVPGSVSSTAEPAVDDTEVQKEEPQWKKVKVLTSEEEHQLAAYILYMQSRNCPLSRRHVRCSVRELIRRSGPTRVLHAACNMRCGPSNWWFQRFLTSQPGLSVEMLDKSKGNANTKALMFYKKYEMILNKQNVHESPSQIFCCKAISFGDCNKENQLMTSLTCTSAVGTFLPCLLIFQGELPEFIAGHQLPAKWLYSAVTGSMEQDIFLVWFVEIFLKSCGSARPVLLLLASDVCYSFKLYQLAVRNQVELLFVTQDTEDTIHPLCGKLCQDLITDFTDVNNNSCKTLDEISVQWEKCLKKLTEIQIQEAFSSSGIFPFEPKSLPGGTHRNRNRRRNHHGPQNNVLDEANRKLTVWTGSSDGCVLEELNRIEGSLQTPLDTCHPQSDDGTQLHKDAGDLCERSNDKAMDYLAENGEEEIHLDGGIAQDNKTVLQKRFEFQTGMGKRGKLKVTESNESFKTKKQNRPLCMQRKRKRPEKECHENLENTDQSLSSCKHKKTKTALSANKRAFNSRTLRSRFGMTKCKENIRFTVVQEKKLCQYLVYLKDQNYPLHYGEVRTAAYVLACEERAVGMECGIHTGRAPSMNWCEKFCSSQPILQENCIVGSSKDMTQRATLKPREILTQFYGKYEKLLAKHMLQECPDQIFVCVDVELPTLTEEKVTSLLCVSASGVVLPSFLIFQNQIPSFEKEGEIIKKWLYAFSSSGCLDPELFYVWFLNILARHCGVEKAGLLLHEPDNQSYFSLMEAATFYRAEFLYFPIEAMHLMNPLRLTVVPQLLSTFTDLSSNKPVTPKQVPSIWNQCLEQVDMATLVRQGFSQTGLYPCESNVIEKWNAGITRQTLSAKSPFIPYPVDVTRIFTGKKLQKQLANEEDRSL